MTHFNDPAIPRFQDPDYFDEPAPDYCCVCDAFYSKDDGEFCDCHCSECGEELPDEKDAHCTNCCECDACYEADLAENPRLVA